MTDKLLELAAAMERNEPVNNPGNWNLLLAAVDYIKQLEDDRSNKK